MAPPRSEREWLESVRGLILRGDARAARVGLDAALIAFPASAELLRARAGLDRQSGHSSRAQQTLEALLARDPSDVASAFELARTLDADARPSAAAHALRTCLVPQGARDPELAIKAIEWLSDRSRQHDASAIAEAALAAHPEDPRLHAYAGMLQAQLGGFECARGHYLFALQHDAHALEWHVALGLANTLCYTDTRHPDIEQFRKGLARPDLSTLARAELHFALGKAHDDVGDFATAAWHFRNGNALRKQLVGWSRKAWRRAAQARLAARPMETGAVASDAFIPVFIVGMPRSGTTLLAARLAAYPCVRNRGELGLLAQLAESPSLAHGIDAAGLAAAAARYAREARQDDAADARWFIDKQPLNFRYVDLALALFPGARIIHCRRGARDNALSLWSQCFLSDAQGYAYDFGDIAAVVRDERRLMDHWSRRFPDAIRTVAYEDLVAAPQPTVDELAAWIGLSPHGNEMPATPRVDAISTASLWQARQPVHQRSVGRWRHYAPHVSELLSIPDD